MIIWRQCGGGWVLTVRYTCLWPSFKLMTDWWGCEFVGYAILECRWRTVVVNWTKLAIARAAPFLCFLWPPLTTSPELRQQSQSLSQALLRDGVSRPMGNVNRTPASEAALEHVPSVNKVYLWISIAVSHLSGHIIIIYRTCHSCES